MLLLTKFRLRLRSLFSRNNVETELLQEMDFHIEQQKAEFVASGMSEGEADSAAKALFGTVAVIEEECRDQRQTRWLEDFTQDVRIALRGFAKSPGFACILIATLALGIGANTAVVSTVYGVMFRPLPYADADRLIVMHDGIAGVGPVTSLRDLSKTVDYAGYEPDNGLNLEMNGEAWRVNATTVTWNLAKVLRVNPDRGRWFHRSEETAGRHREAVISDRMWRNRFGADPSIIGRRILLNEQPFEVIGVMPASFAFPSPETELWVPIHIDARDVGYVWGGGFLWPIGRLRDGFNRSAAQAELGPAMDRVRAMFPWRMPDSWGTGISLLPFSESLSESVKPKLFALAGAAILLLIIACGNVANLLLSRAVLRDREFAMRAALGAGKGRILRQLLTENIVLTAFGGMAGFAAAALLLHLLPLLLPRDTPRLHEITIDGSVIAAAAISMLITMVLFGAAPLFRFAKSRRDVLGGRAVTSSRQAARMSLGLIGVELALSTALLIGAGLMARTLLQLGNVDGGVRTAGVVSARLSATAHRCGTAERCWATLSETSQALIRLPGVRSVSWSNIVPLEKELFAIASDIEDHPRPEGAPAYVLWQTAATPGYFQTLGIPLRAGRFFTDADRRGSVPVIIIGESTAKRYWPNQNPIGKRIRPMSDLKWRTVVGVVGDVAQYALTGYPDWIDGVEYAPLAQIFADGEQSAQLYALVQSANPKDTATLLPGVIRGEFPDIVVSRVASLDAIRSDSLAGQRSTAMLLTVFAALGLLLGMSGVYGVISHRAALRTREIGIRMALGASSSWVINMVLRETAVVAFAGIAGGLGMAWVLSRFLQSLIFGITSHDVMTFVICPAVMLSVAVSAAMIPALRASRTDPGLVLREE